MKGLEIDPEFQRLIPPLSDDERRLLEANILAEGCREPLVVWGRILLDGHNRHEICVAHELPFETVQAEGIEDRCGAREWMLRNQLGRRNLSPSAAADLRGMLYRGRKKPHGGDRRSKGQNDPLNAADRVAAEQGVSPKTVKRDASYSEALDTLEKIEPDIRHKLHKRDGKVGKAIGKADAIKIAKLPEELQRAVIDKVVKGEARNATAAIQQVKREQRLAARQQTQLPQGVVGRDGKRQRIPYEVREGDALEALASLDDHSIHLVVTDPPYGLDTHRTRLGGHDYADGAEYALELLERTAEVLVRKCTPGAHLYVFSGYSHAWRFRDVLARHFEVNDNPLVWEKNRATIAYPEKAKFANKYELIWFCRAPGELIGLNSHATDVFHCDAVSPTQSTGHSAEKPVELLSRFIRLSSARGELVCDPFCGSGSTGEAASKLERAFLGIELDPKWAAVARAREPA